MATLDKVSLDIPVVLGTTAMPVHQVLRLGRGAIIELDASEDDEVQILANNLPVAKGTVVVSGNRIAVEVKRSAAACARRALRRPPARPRIRGLVPLEPICYIAALTRRIDGAFTPHAVMAELVDALA